MFPCPTAERPRVRVQWQLLALQAAVVAVVAALFYFLRPGKGSTYLIDFYCLRPPNRCNPQSSYASWAPGT